MQTCLQRKCLCCVTLGKSHPAASSSSPLKWGEPPARGRASRGKAPRPLSGPPTVRAHCPLALHPRRTPSPGTPGSRLSSPHKLALRAAEAASPAPRIIYSYTRQALGLGSGRYLPSPRPHQDDQEGDAGGDPSSPPAAPVPGPHWFPRPSPARLGREPGPAPALGGHLAPGLRRTRGCVSARVRGGGGGPLPSQDEARARGGGERAGGSPARVPRGPGGRRLRQAGVRPAGRGPDPAFPAGSPRTDRPAGRRAAACAGGAAGRGRPCWGCAP